MDEMDEMQEILEEFFTEADESLDELEQDLIKLETMAEDGGEVDGEVVDRLFRVLHTLKGGAGFLGLEYMAKLAHAGENLFDEIRAAKVDVDKDVMDALLQTNDLLKELLEAERNQEDASVINTAPIVAELERLMPGGDKSPAPKAEVEPETPVAETTVEPEVIEVVADTSPTAAPTLLNQDLLNEIASDDRLTGTLDIEAINAATQAGEPLGFETETEEEPAPAETSSTAAPTLLNQDLLNEIASDDRLTGTLDIEAINAATQAGESLGFASGTEEPAPEAVVETPVTPEAKVVEKAAPTPKEEDIVLKRGEAKPDERRKEDDRRKPESRRKAPRRKVEAADATIRVETSKLDSTMNLVGELVLARNALVRFLNLSDMKSSMEHVEGYANVVANLEHLSRVTQDLQMSVLSIRMQAIKKVFDKIPRQVRELKNKLNREVNLVIEGEMTEVDKTLVEELADPMVHLIRNALDHGIETPEDRIAVGKKAEGTLLIRAFYEGNKVVIQIRDDGKGIDPEQIRNIAIKKGVVDERTANNMSDADAVKLIMAPGFSTAEVISDVSGRGVGMDVVNSSIQAISGTVDIISEFGVGTTINIYLPLTLAIVQALVVGAKKEGFAIPIGDINEVIKYEPDAVHKMNDKDVIKRRGEALPLFYLKDLVTQSRRKLVTEYDGKSTEVVEETIDAPAVDAAEVPVVDEVRKSAASAHEHSEAIQGYIVVVKVGSNGLGVVVDELLGQEEAVVKAISNAFEYNKAISGATITGDGSVHMILDVPFLIKSSTSKVAN